MPAKPCRLCVRDGRTPAGSRRSGWCSRDDCPHNHRVRRHDRPPAAVLAESRSESAGSEVVSAAMVSPVIEEVRQHFEGRSPGGTAYEEVSSTSSQELREVNLHARLTDLFVAARAHWDALERAGEALREVTARRAARGRSRSVRRSRAARPVPAAETSACPAVPAAAAAGGAAAPAAAAAAAASGVPAAVAVSPRRSGGSVSGASDTERTSTRLAMKQETLRELKAKWVNLRDEGRRESEGSQTPGSARVPHVVAPMPATGAELLQFREGACGLRPGQRRDHSGAVVGPDSASSCWVAGANGPPSREAPHMIDENKSLKEQLKAAGQPVEEHPDGKGKGDRRR